MLIMLCEWSRVCFLRKDDHTFLPFSLGVAPGVLRRVLAPNSTFSCLVENSQHFYVVFFSCFNAPLPQCRSCRCFVFCTLKRPIFSTNRFVVDMRISVFFFVLHFRFLSIDTSLCVIWLCFEYCFFFFLYCASTIC